MTTVTSKKELSDILGEVLDAAIALTEADFGNIQLLDPDGRLRIVVHRGFPDWWIEYWNTVTAGHGVCGSSLARDERVVVEDVEQSPIFCGTPALDIQLKAGVRAVQSTPLRGQPGQVLGMLSTHYRTPHRPDIQTLKVLDLLAEHAATLIEREKAEESLCIYQARLDFLLSSNPAVIYTCQAQPPYAATFISRNIKELMGFAPEQFTNDPNFWADHIHADDRPQVFEDLHALFEHGEHRHEYRFQIADGSYRRMLDHVKVVYSASREPQELIGYWIDITGRKQVEEMLRASERLLAEAQRMGKIGSWEWDIKTGEVRCSRENYNIFRLDPEVFIPSVAAFQPFIHADDREFVERNMAQIISTSTPSEFEFRIIAADGTPRVLFTKVEVTRFEADGKPRVIMGINQDITERKHAEAEAQQHSQLMQAMAKQQVAVHTAAAFAHELNQPLVSIAAYSEVALRVLRSGKEKTDQFVRAIEGSHEQALRAGRVLHDLIDHLHKGETESKPFDINALVTEVDDKMRKAQHREFQAALNLEPGLPPVLGNRLQTEKVLLNLIRNGLDAMEDAKVAHATFAIAVRTLAGHNMAHVTVRDSGPGLDADTACRIFDSFFTTKPNGLGLGLAISRSLIEAQGGQLWLDPDEGPGAVFHFTLPFAHE